MKIAYIDSQNIKLWIRELWREIDWRKLFDYLKFRYNMDIIKIFMWYKSSKQERYDDLLKIWYMVVFKKTHERNGKIKWNADSMIMLHWVVDAIEWKVKNAYLISWDWDFDVLIDFWKEKWIFKKIFIPNHNKISKLLIDSTDVKSRIFCHTIENKIKKS